MVVGVITNVRRLARSATDDTTRAAIPCAWRCDRVLMVIAAPLRGKEMLAIAERDAITLVRERSSGADETQHVARFGGQFGDRDFAALGSGFARASRRYCEDRRRDQRDGQPLAQRRRRSMHPPSVTLPGECAAYASRRVAASRAISQRP